MKLWDECVFNRPVKVTREVVEDKADADGKFKKKFFQPKYVKVTLIEVDHTLLESTHHYTFQLIDFIHQERRARAQHRTGQMAEASTTHRAPCGTSWPR